MSEEVYCLEGVHISTYAGPAGAPGERRTRVQIMVDGRYIQLSMRQWATLRVACEHLELEGTPS